MHTYVLQAISFILIVGAGTGMTLSLIEKHQFFTEVVTQGLIYALHKESLYPYFAEMIALGILGGAAAALSMVIKTYHTSKPIKPTPVAIKSVVPIALKQPTDKLEGWVYLLRASSGLYKIGHTANPNNRIRTFSVKLPFDVEYEHLIHCKNRFAAERQLHKRYADKRVRGEWFNLSQFDVNQIKILKEL